MTWNEGTLCNIFMHVRCCFDWHHMNLKSPVLRSSGCETWGGDCEDSWLTLDLRFGQLERCCVCLVYNPQKLMAGTWNLMVEQKESPFPWLQFLGSTPLSRRRHSHHFPNPCLWPGTGSYMFLTHTSPCPPIWVLGPTGCIGDPGSSRVKVFRKWFSETTTKSHVLSHGLLPKIIQNTRNSEGIWKTKIGPIDCGYGWADPGSSLWS